MEKWATTDPNEIEVGVADGSAAPLRVSYDAQAGGYSITKEVGNEWLEVAFVQMSQKRRRK